MNILNLLAVVPDGFDILAPTIQPLNITIVDNYQINVSIFSSNGLPLNISGALIFTVKQPNYSSLTLPPIISRMDHNHMFS